MALVIEFDRNKAAVKPRNNDQLRKVADFLKATPVTATVEGHTGNLKGTPEELHVASKLRAGITICPLLLTVVKSCSITYIYHK